MSREEMRREPMRESRDENQGKKGETDRRNQIASHRQNNPQSGTPASPVVLFLVQRSIAAVQVGSAEVARRGVDKVSQLRYFLKFKTDATSFKNPNT